MIRHLAAFAWLRLHLLRNGFRGRRRDSFEMIAAIAAIFVPVVILVFFLAGATLLGWLAFLAATSLASGGIERDPVFLGIRMVLFALLGVVLLFPVGRGSHASLASHPRFMLLPIPRRFLHGLEVATTLSDPWILIAVPALVLMPAGLTVAGRSAAGFLTLMAGVLFLAAIVCLAALASYTVQFVLRDRRRGETATLIGAIALMLVGLVPAFLSASDPDHEMKIVILHYEDLVWIPVLPSELYTMTMGSSLDGGLPGALLPLGGLLVEVVLLYALSGFVFNRLIGSVETGRTRRQQAAFPRLPDIPLLGHGTVAVALITMRGALRTIKGKLSVFVPGPMTLLFGVLLPRLPVLRPFVNDAERLGPLFLALAGLMCLLSLHPILLNQFATDRSGLSLLFVSPLDDRTLIRGKAAGGAALFGMALLPCVVASVIVLPGGSPLLWLATLLTLLAAYAWMVAPAAALSVFFPKPSNLNTMGSAGNPHALASILGFLMTAFVVAPGSGMVGLLMGRPLLALAMSGLWAGVSLLAALPLMNLAAVFLAERRESLSILSGERAT